MPMAKLTLSADVRTISQAKRLAKKGNTSVSAMFSRYVESLARVNAGEADPLGPITRRASGIVRLPKGKSDRELIEDALAAKHGRRK